LVARKRGAYFSPGNSLTVKIAIGIMDKLERLLTNSTQRHARLCPRQVLGVRMGMLAGKILGLDLPQKDKRLFTFAESDGCGTGGISLATGCWVDRRTLKVMDFGKLAGTFVDTHTGRAIRIIPSPGCRTQSNKFAPDAPDLWHAYLESYQLMPDEELFIVQQVSLTLDIQKIISTPGLRVACDRCGEEILNQREVLRDRLTLCRYCAGDIYYTVSTLPTDLTFARSFPASTASYHQNYGYQSIPVITVIGKSKSGKTTLLEKLISEIKARGYRVGTVKHHSHVGFDIDHPGKDSWRHARAGSHHVVIAAPDKIASYRLLERELTLDEIVADIEDVDIILTEGYMQAGKPTLEVLRSENSLDLISSPEQHFAVAADVPLDVAVPQYDLNDIKGIADMLESRFLQNRHDIV